MHCFSEIIETSEREGQVREAARYVTVRALLLNSLCSLYKLHAIGIMLFHPSGYGEYIQVKYDVLWWKPDLLSEQLVCPLRYRHFLVSVSGLALFVKGHDYDGRPVPEDSAGFAKEILLALLEGDAVDDTLALGVLQTRLDHLKFTRVDHHWDVGDLGVRLEETHELGHCLLSID